MAIGVCIMSTDQECGQVILFLAKNHMHDQFTFSMVESENCYMYQYNIIIVNCR